MAQVERKHWVHSFVNHLGFILCSAVASLACFRTTGRDSVGLAGRTLSPRLPCRLYLPRRAQLPSAPIRITWASLTAPPSPPPSPPLSPPDWLRPCDLPQWRVKGMCTPRVARGESALVTAFCVCS